MNTITMGKDRVKRRLEAELAGITKRLRTGLETPDTDAVRSDFLDAAQAVEHQELAGLSASRLNERARRLRLALKRVSDGDYGTCAECGAAIPARRLQAVPDATTCVACQARLELRHVDEVGARSVE
jgi:phage/conjugal plasmid C-4 type zinc finger TraR family protein